LVAEGQQNKEIAQALGLSPRTVEFHKARIMSKLHIRSTAGLTKFALARGLANV
jgi:DNA-binding NarL/FixJ family response regulator